MSPFRIAETPPLIVGPSAVFPLLMHVQAADYMGAPAVLLQVKVEDEMNTTFLTPKIPFAISFDNGLG